MAFLDESQSYRDLDPDTYVLAASVCGPAMLQPARDTISSLRLRGQRKLHWRDESGPRRQLITDTIAEMPLEHVIVVRDGRTSERPERLRRHCMERMLYELDQLAVATATFESRGRADDGRDRAMLDALRARKMITSELRIAHQRGHEEALLWVADAVCGAVTQQRVGNSGYLKTIVDQVRVQVIGISAP
jgi:hypothetical protein